VAGDKKRLLFLHTGGTLGMAAHGDPGSLAPSHYAENVLPFVKGLEEQVELEGVQICNIDSSDMTPTLWEKMARTIAENIERYDGFVVLHGTDTMAWSATALSFMLENLPRPVVFTGAQRPLAELRSDARMNIIHSAICATLDIPEVGLYFGDSLFRGNRATKTSIQSYQAFDSPNLPPLVRMGVGMQRHTPPLKRDGPFRLSTGFSTYVSVLHLFPGMSAGAIRRAIHAGAEGVVVFGFGSGNLPLNDWAEAIREAGEQGVPVVVGSQCTYGWVDLSAYEGGAWALSSGALSASEMTREAATVKLMYLLGQGMDLDGVRARWSQPLAGEISDPG
jgi:L-asparaginase